MLNSENPEQTNSGQIEAWPTPEMLQSETALDVETNNRLALLESPSDKDEQGDPNYLKELANFVEWVNRNLAD